MSNWRLLLPGLALAITTAMGPAPVHAQGSTAEGAAAERLLLVLSVATDDDGKQREQRFVEELELALEGVPVRVIPPATPGFIDRSLGQQITEVRPLIEEHSAIAAAWVIELAPDLLLLHMVAVSSGRALARLVEMPPAPGIEADLAMAARELLGTAFLFHDLPAEATPVAQVVESVRREAAPEAPEVQPTVEPVERDAGLALIAGGAIGGGVYGHTGPSLHAGGLAGIELAIRGALRGRLLLGAFGGFLDRDEAAGVRSWTLAPGLGLALLWGRGAVTLGPAIEIQLQWANVVAELDGGQEQRFESFRYTVAALLELRWWVGDRVGLLAAAGIAATPEREEFFRQSSASVVLATPYLEWTARVGLALRL